MAPLLDSDSAPNTKLRLVTIRHHLAENIRLSPSNARLVELRVEVDAALDRLASNRYGVCEICGAQIDPRTLQVDPLIRHCFSHLSNDAQTKALWARRMANELEAPLDVLTATALQTALPLFLRNRRKHRDLQPYGENLQPYRKRREDYSLRASSER